MDSIDKEKIKLESSSSEDHLLRNSENLLEVRNLKTYFYTEAGIVRAVEGVSFEIKKNEILGLVGESGCGKSVTALSLLNLVRFPGLISEGEVIFNDKDLLQMPDEDIRQIRGNKISMIFQDPMSTLNPLFTVSEQIGEVIQLHRNVTKNDSIAEAIDIMNHVGIPRAKDRVDDYPHHFSGGMRQRIMIGRAISNKPSLLIADEPTTALDVTIQAQILDIIKVLKEEEQMSVLLITHNLGIVAETCHRVMVMYGGFIVEQAEVKNIFINPVHPYTIALMSAIPRLDVKIDRLETLPGNVPDLINPPTGCRFHPRCKFAKQHCTEEEPHLVEFEPEHYVSCFEYKEVMNSPEREKLKKNFDASMKGF